MNSPVWPPIPTNTRDRPLPSCSARAGAANSTARPKRDAAAIRRAMASSSGGDDVSRATRQAAGGKRHLCRIHDADRRSGNLSGRVLRPRQTESIYKRYAVVSEADLAEGV